jgi:tetratricopeptide (TPR) repeat protein
LEQAEYLFNQHFNQGRSRSMLSKMCTAAIMAASIAMLISASQIARASDNPALDADILSVAEEWAKVKYLSETDGERKEKMAPVGAKADQLVKRYPGRVEALIWDGIVTSDRASLTWGLTALNLATRARDLLLEAEKLDPKAVDAGAPTSLGVLYYRVPGFPVGWGDTNKARHYLEEAVKNAPNGRDAHYFYADFLYEQGEYKQAEEVVKTALALPHHPERPIWDKYFPKVIESLLEKIHEKTKS